MVVANTQLHALPQVRVPQRRCRRNQARMLCGVTHKNRGPAAHCGLRGCLGQGRRCLAGAAAGGAEHQGGLAGGELGHDLEDVVVQAALEQEVCRWGSVDQGCVARSIADSVMGLQTSCFKLRSCLVTCKTSRGQGTPHQATTAHLFWWGGSHAPPYAA